MVRGLVRTKWCHEQGDETQQRASPLETEFYNDKSAYRDVRGEAQDSVAYGTRTEIDGRWAAHLLSYICTPKRLRSSTLAILRGR